MAETSNKTRFFFGEEDSWVGARIVMEEHHKSEHFHRIALYGTGHVIVIEGDKDHGGEKRYEYRLPQPEATRIFQHAVEKNVIGIEIPPAEYPDDWVNVAFSFRNINESYEGKDKLKSEKHDGFDAFYQEFVKLREGAKGLEPIQSDAYPWYNTNIGASAGRIGLFKAARHLRNFELRDCGRLLVQIVMVSVFLWQFWLIGLAMLGLAYFVAGISPDYSYGFGSGVLHGFFVLQNYLLSFFDHRHTRAPLNSGFGYAAGYYIGFLVIPLLIEAFTAVTSEFRRK